MHVTIRYLDRGTGDLVREVAKPLDVVQFAQTDVQDACRAPKLLRAAREWAPDFEIDEVGDFTEISGLLEVYILPDTK